MRSGPALRRPNPAQPSLSADYNAAGRGPPGLRSGRLLTDADCRDPWDSGSRSGPLSPPLSTNLVGTLHAPVLLSARSGPSPTSVRPKGHPSTDAEALEFIFPPPPYNAAGRGPAAPSLCGLSGISACAPGPPSAALLQLNLLCRLITTPQEEVLLGSAPVYSSLLLIIGTPRTPCPIQTDRKSV